jgi:hypothetical protein
VVAAIWVVAAVLAGTGVTATILLYKSHHRSSQDFAQIASRSTPLAEPDSHSGSTSPSQSATTSPSQGGIASPAQSGAVLSSSPPPSSSPPGDAQVTVTTSAAQDSDASSVAALLDQYFTTINTHNYEAYISLHTLQAQQGLKVEQLAKGYSSTVDSSEVLTSISAAPNGDTVATFTFVSHQNPSDSVDGTESCTDWRISLFLQQGSTGYLIGPTAPGYRSTHSPC